MLQNLPYGDMNNTQNSKELILDRSGPRPSWHQQLFLVAAVLPWNGQVTQGPILIGENPMGHGALNLANMQVILTTSGRG
jgi:hypothetical protein